MTRSESPRRILDVSVSPDGSLMATASDDNNARVWNLFNPVSTPVELQGHSGGIALVAFSAEREGPDGDARESRFVFTISRQDGTARIWDTDGGEPLHVLGTRKDGFNSITIIDPAGPRQYSDDVTSVAFSSDGKLLITGHGDGMAHVYSLDHRGNIQYLSEVAARGAASLGICVQDAATPATEPRSRLLSEPISRIGVSHFSRGVIN